MTRLLQISDLHFGTEVPQVVEALVRMAHATAPDVLVVSGDLTQRATAHQFAAARHFVDRLGVAVMLAIPGNHDISLHKPWERLLRPYAAMQAAFGSVLETAYATDDLLLVTVNTTRAYRHKNGEVSASQIERVAERLRAATPRQARIVVTHQPIAVARPQDEPDLLRGGGAALQAWAAAGADVVLGGHIHLPYLLPVPQQALAGKGPLWVINAGTAVSHRTRHEAGNSVNLLHLSSPAAGRHCRAERWDYVPRVDAFQRVATDELHWAAPVVLPSPLRPGNGRSV